VDEDEGGGVAGDGEIEGRIEGRGGVDCISGTNKVSKVVDSVPTVTVGAVLLIKKKRIDNLRTNRPFPPLRKLSEKLANERGTGERSCEWSLRFSIPLSTICGTTAAHECCL
jgi:hypothetical protein